MHLLLRWSACAALLALAACSRGPAGEHREPEAGHAEAPKAAASTLPTKDASNTKPESEEREKSDAIALSEKQIRDAGIEVAAVRAGFAGAIEAPAVVAADPQLSALVVSAVGGRVIEIRKQLGDTVKKGELLAIIDSREAAQLGADVAIARRQMELAEAAFRREERLFAEKVSSRQDYELAKAALEDSRTRLRLAEQQLANAGGATQSSRVSLRAPIDGVITARQIALGDMAEANAKLFEVVNLNPLSVELSLAPADAARLAVGAAVDVMADNRSGNGRIVSLSRVIDPATRQVRAIASLPNPVGNWRIGETVRVSVALADKQAGGQLAIPRTALQTIEDKPSVFVRTKEGFAIRHVVLGPAAAGYVTVQSGLDGTERIAVSNSYILKAEHGKGEAGEDHD